MPLPQRILERVDRVYAHHRASKLHYTGRPLSPESAEPPEAHARFPGLATVSLPTVLLDAPQGTLAVMASALDALPDSFIGPPQTLKTLASWLFLADGMIAREQALGDDERTCPGVGRLYPYEIYVAAMSVEGLEPGLYHYNPLAFSLCKVRGGSETVRQLTRGRPDLRFVSGAPAAVLVSTVFSRASWEFGPRGYRAAMLDAGHLVQNLVTTAGGLGIQTITRLRMTDSSMRDLIGMTQCSDYTQQEAIQAMVVWADGSDRLAARPRRNFRRPARESVPVSMWRGPDLLGSPKGTRTINAGGAAVASLHVTDLHLPTPRRRTLDLLPRSPLGGVVRAHAAILSAHRDCVTPGVAVREIRPPLTELTPMPANLSVVPMPAAEAPADGVPLRSLLLEKRPIRDFRREPLPRDTIRAIARLSFRAGSYFPLFPDGPYAALVRPFWVIHDVMGMESGIWYYRAEIDAWCLLRPHGFRLETMYLACEDPAFGDASAVCFMVANVHRLMLEAGPDTYRLALLEAGLVAQRLSLAARGLGLGSRATANFFDDELKLFLGLARTGWEPLAGVAVGMPVGQI